MPRPYSEDLRWRTIWMKEILGFQVDEVAAALWMSRMLEALIRQRKLKWLFALDNLAFSVYFLRRQ